MRPFFRHHPLDALPALCGMAIVGLLLATLVCFDSLPCWLLILAFGAVACSYCWNMQCISHNFIHNPFFTSSWVNRAYSIVESLGLGVPHVLYHHYHRNHHWGASDALGSNGTTRDWSSIYRYGRHGRAEGFWRYSVLSFFRVEVKAVLRATARHHQLAQLAIESVALGAFWLVMVLLNWRYFLLFYLPSYYLGWVLSYMEGYLEHFGAVSGNRLADSVSSYHRLYNLLWFNNGYHQEHHWDPKTHWTRMNALHRDLKSRLKANGTRTLYGPHFTGLIEDWVRKSARANAPRQPTRQTPPFAA